jgi:hypothetical protein
VAAAAGGAPAAASSAHAGIAQIEQSAVTPASTVRLINRESIHVSGFKGPKLTGVDVKE